MIIKTRMEMDWKKQVSARHNGTVWKAVIAPSPEQEAGRPHTPTILLSGQYPLLPCHPQPGPWASPASSLPPPPPVLRTWGRSSWKLALVGLLMADIKQESNQSSHRQAARRSILALLFILVAQRQCHKTSASGRLQAPPE